MSYRFPLSLTVLAVLAGVASAQVTPFEIGVGYGQSGTFDKDSGGRGKLEGPELSISQAYLKLPFVGEAKVGASMLFGGQLKHGSDADGSVFRLFARYNTPAVGNGIYGIGGFWWGRAKGRGGSFGTLNRSGIDLGVGLPLNNPVGKVVKSSLELVNHQSARAQFRGWTLMAVFRL